MLENDPRIDPDELRNVRFPGSARKVDARAVERFLDSVRARVEATNDLVDELLARAEMAEAAAASFLAADGDVSAADLAAVVPPEPVVDSEVEAGVDPEPEPEVVASAPSIQPELPPLAELDDDELVRLIGEETAAVLATARRSAAEIRSKAEESAARVIKEATTEAKEVEDRARADADELRSEASSARDDAVARAEEAAAEIRSTAEAEATRVVEDARAKAAELIAEGDELLAVAAEEAERVVEEAKSQGRTMLAEAKDVRGRVLDDLQRRRDAARLQIEQLLEGRERLLAALGDVQTRVDEATTALHEAVPGDRDDDAFADDTTDAMVDELLAENAARPAAEAETALVAEPEVATGPEPTTVRDEEPDDTVVTAPVAPDPADAAVDAEVEVEPEVTEADPVEPDPVEPEPVEMVDPDPDEPEVVAAEPILADDPDPESDDDDDTVVDLTGNDTDHPVLGPEHEQRDSSDGPGTSPSDDAETDDPDTGDTDSGDPEGSDVDQLFARLRAERQSSVADARRVLEATPAPAEVAVESTAPSATESAPTAPAPVEPVPAAAPVEPAATAGDVEHVPVEFLADAGRLEARSTAIGGVAPALARAVKRRLADEQNDVLDMLRRTGATDLASLYPPADDHVATYATLATTHLAAVAEAGGGEPVDVTTLADDLAAQLVQPLRRRVERAAAEIEDDADELDERLRALYREWKVQVIGPAVDDALLSAYAHGQWSATPEGTALTWRIDPAQGPCPDAQDNALAGPVPRGEAFPTGDACPQAHPGCRCLLELDGA